MQQSPLTDKTFNISSAEKFRDVRAKSKQEEFIRKSKRNKQEKEPKFNIDDEVVVSSNFRTMKKEYCLVKVIDMDKRFGEYMYYAVILKITDKNKINRLGHLTTFYEKFNYFEYIDARVKDNGSIKWVV
jgi:hypothetical protein